MVSSAAHVIHDLGRHACPPGERHALVVGALDQIAEHMEITIAQPRIFDGAENCLELGEVELAPVLSNDVVE